MVPNRSLPASSAVSDFGHVVEHPADLRPREVGREREAGHDARKRSGPSCSAAQRLMSPSVRVSCHTIALPTALPVRRSQADRGLALVGDTDRGEIGRRGARPVERALDHLAGPRRGSRPGRAPPSRGEGRSARAPSGGSPPAAPAWSKSMNRVLVVPWSRAPTNFVIAWGLPWCGLWTAAVEYRAAGPRPSARIGRRPTRQSARSRVPATAARPSGAPRDPRRHRPQRRRARRRQPRDHRLAVQAPRLRLPVVRDLRRHQRRVGLRAPGRRAQEQRQARLVAGDGPGPQRHRGPGRRDPDAPAGLGHVGPRRLVQRPAGRVRRVPPPVPARRAARHRGPQPDRPARRDHHRAPGPRLPQRRHAALARRAGST